MPAHLIMLIVRTYLALHNKSYRAPSSESNVALTGVMVVS